METKTFTTVTGTLEQEATATRQERVNTTNATAEIKISGKQPIEAELPKYARTKAQIIHSGYIAGFLLLCTVLIIFILVMIQAVRASLVVALIGLALYFRYKSDIEYMQHYEEKTGPFRQDHHQP